MVDFDSNASVDDQQKRIERLETLTLMLVEEIAILTGGVLAAFAFFGLHIYSGSYGWSYGAGVVAYLAGNHFSGRRFTRILGFQI
jgi:hypothetical protein